METSTLMDFTSHPIISSLIGPKVKKFADKLETKIDRSLFPNIYHFGEYLNRAYTKNSIVNIIALKNRQIRLLDIYIPLSLKSSQSSSKVIKIDGYPKDFMDKYQKMIIIDSAGMGKSTISKRMFIDIVNKQYAIPVLIELRRLNADHKIIDEIHDQLSPIDRQFDLKLLLSFITTGDFIFIFDGLDEVPSNNKNSVIEDIQDFTSKCDNNQFIITSRPDSSLSCFGNYLECNISPLTVEESYQLIEKYDNHNENSRLLISKLKQGEYKILKDYLSNPLLVSLLYNTFNYKQIIPLKKNLFYRQVYDALFEGHDLSKGGCYVHEKESKLSIDDFERVLRYMAFICLKENEIEFSKERLLKIITVAKGQCGLDFKPSSFFNDIIKNVPLFVIDGIYYKWIHRSIQEYFAALFIYVDAKEHRIKILEKLSKADSCYEHENILDLYSDIDPEGFEQDIIYPLLRGYIEFCEKNDYFQDDNIRNRAPFVYFDHIKLVNRNLLFDDFSTTSEVIKKVGFDNTKSNLTHGLIFVDDGLVHNYEFMFVNSFNRMNILPLLYKKYRSLYNPRMRISKKDINIIYDQKNIIFNVDFELFQDNELSYKLMNKIIASSLSHINIDYYKAKVFVDKLNRKINNRNSSFFEV